MNWFLNSLPHLNRVDAISEQKKTGTCRKHIFDRKSMFVTRQKTDLAGLIYKCQTFLSPNCL